MKLKEIWTKYKPVFFTNEKFILFLIQRDIKGRKVLTYFMRPVIQSLKELEKNTWDKHRARNIIEVLESMFGEKE